MTTTTEALRLAREALRARDTYGWSTEADVALERMRSALSAIDAATAAAPSMTGRSPEHLLQDQDRGLSRWLADKPDARMHAREAAAAIAAPSVELVAWVNGAAFKSAAVSRERGGPYDLHTWSDARTAYHDTPLTVAATPQAQPADHAVQSKRYVADLEDTLRQIADALGVPHHQPEALIAAARTVATPQAQPAAVPLTDERPSRADLIAALTFYASGGHMNLSDQSA